MLAGWGMPVLQRHQCLLKTIIFAVANQALSSSVACTLHCPYPLLLPTIRTLFEQPAFQLLLPCCGCPLILPRQHPCCIPFCCVQRHAAQQGAVQPPLTAHNCAPRVARVPLMTRRPRSSGGLRVCERPAIAHWWAGAPVLSGQGCDTNNQTAVSKPTSITHHVGYAQLIPCQSELPNSPLIP